MVGQIARTLAMFSVDEIVLFEDNSSLEKAGLRVWLDEQQMRGDVNQQMVDGIDDSACVLCFVTTRYMEKVSGKGPSGANDNCAPALSAPHRPRGRSHGASSHPDAQASSSSTMRFAVKGWHRCCLS